MALQGLVEQGIILQVVRGELTTKFASSATSTYVDIWSECYHNTKSINI